MKHKVEVVTLPTKNNSHIYRGGDHFEFSPDFVKGHKSWVSQYLYITISQDVEPIKEGDWYYYPDILGVEGVQQCESKEHLKELQTTTTYKGFKKIIATNDPKLTSKRVCFQCGGTGETTFSSTYTTQKVCDVCQGDKTLGKPIPQIQQSFIKEFVKNPKGKWEVEYAVFLEMNDPRGKYTEYRLKLNQHNIVNLSLIKGGEIAQMLRDLRDTTPCDENSQGHCGCEKFDEIIDLVEEDTYSKKEVIHLMRLSIARGAHLEAKELTENPSPCLGDDDWIKKQL